MSSFNYPQIPFTEIGAVITSIHKSFIIFPLTRLFKDNYKKFNYKQNGVQKIYKKLIGKII